MGVGAKLHVEIPMELSYVIRSDVAHPLRLGGHMILKARLFACILLGCAWFSGIGSAQSRSPEDFDFYLDYARFRGPQGFGFLELYFGVPRTGLNYLETDQGLQAEFEIQIDISADDSLISTRTLENRDLIPSDEAIQPGQTIQDLHSYYLRPDTYSIRSRVRDLNSGHRKEKTVEIAIPDYGADRLALSDIELALHIARDQGESKFVKNGYRILPNPGRLYTPSGPILYYYLEIYGLSPLQSGADSTYSVSAVLLDKNGRFIRTVRDKIRKRTGSSLVEVGNVHVGGLSTDAYALQISVRDHAAADTASVRIFFYVVRPQDLVRSGGGEVTADYSRDIEFLSMDEDELDRHFEYAGYLATRQESKAYEKLDLTGKRTFMQDFWQKRDSNVLTDPNEFKDDYYERLRLAQQKYSTPNRKGWKTDRGRVLLLYGRPDDIKRYTSGDWGKPYEIWQYYKIEGGVEFIFADISGYGEYKLIHSTVTNELHDYDWRERLN